MSTEHVVAQVNDLDDGQMKEVQVGERKILLARAHGEFFALGATCPHEGAPLAEGLLFEHQVRCPWHQSVFDVRSGEHDEPPALDDVPHFAVSVRGQAVVLTLPDAPAESAEPPMARQDLDADPRTFVILGTGAAGAVAAETLRREGFRGRVVMLTRELHAPYDRTTLSKSYLAKADAPLPFLRSRPFYINHDIEILTEHEVERVDLAAKTVRCADGLTVPYDKLLLATGGTPRPLDVPGESLKNVFPLRQFDDCRRIRAAVRQGGRAVVVGGGFIGMEVSASLRKRGMEVTVVMPGNAPFEKILGERIGRMVRKLHEENGVRFCTGREVERFDGDADDQLTSVLLDDGERLDADLAVIGVGVQPLTGYLDRKLTNADGSIRVDRRMQAAKNIYAAGDIASFPDWRTGQPIRIEHWRLAQQLGRVAARNMAGRETEYRGVPFFWTNQFRLSLEYVGYARDWDEIIYEGQPEQRDFVAYFVKDGHVLAAAGANQERKMCLIAQLLRGSKPLTVKEIQRAWDAAQQHAPTAS